MPMGIGLGIGVTRGGGLGWWQSGAALDLDFADSLGFNSIDRTKLTPDSILTYTNPSAKMVYGSDGVLRYAPHNLLTYSEQFDNAAWTKTNATISANAIAAPDGTITADKFIPSGASAPDIRTTLTFVASAYHLSVRVKKGEDASIAGINFSCAGTAAADVTVNIETGALIGSAGAPVISYGSESLGDGWYRVYANINNTFAGSTTARFALRDISDNAYAGGNGVTGIYLWGAQLNLGSSALTYIPTTTAAVYSLPIDHNPTTFEPLGVLIEEQRTNLLLRSQEFDNAAWTKTRATITANSVVAPDGTTTADTLAEDGTASSSHFIQQSVTVVSGTAYVLSVYAKKGTRDWLAFQFSVAGFPGTGSTLEAYFNLNTGVVGAKGSNISSHGMQDVGNGWYRCWAIATADASVSSDFLIIAAEADNDFTYSGLSAASLYIWGAQLE